MSETVTCEECGDEVPKGEATRRLGPGLGNETWYCSTECAFQHMEGTSDE